MLGEPWLRLRLGMFAKVLTELKILGHGICMAGMQTVMGKAGAGNVDMSTIEGAASRKQIIEECEEGSESTSEISLRQWQQRSQQVWFGKCK